MVFFCSYRPCRGRTHGPSPTPDCVRFADLSGVIEISPLRGELFFRNLLKNGARIPLLFEEGVHEVRGRCMENRIYPFTSRHLFTSTFSPRVAAIIERARFTSSTVPTHSNGLTGAVPFSSSKIGCNVASAIRSLPKMAVSLSCERNGERIIQVNRHFGQWPHHESVLLPTLQLRNTL